jgi:hypothetical protein
MNSREKIATVEAIGGRKDKQMQTFRIPRPLVAFLKAEAMRGGRDMTAHVVRWLEGCRTHFGLPEAAAALLEADRKSLAMERYEYMLHALYLRSLELREKGVGFDAPSSEEARERARRASQERGEP